MKHDIMIDIETLGTNSKAPIIQIGAYSFSDKTNLIVNIDFESAVNHGEPDGATIKWWFKQSNAARESLFKETPRPLKEALEWLTNYIMWIRDSNESVRIWAYSPSFDLAILRSAYKSVGLKVPWGYREEYDARTLVNLFGDHLTSEQYGLKHNALDDAISQSRSVKKILDNVKWVEEKE